jgi:hypothetical protein
MYFLIYEEWKAILLVSMGVKKVQPETIAMIKQNLAFYKEFTYQTLKEQGLI